MIHKKNWDCRYDTALKEGSEWEEWEEPGPGDNLVTPANVSLLKNDMAKIC